jgi:hypothetical protein
VSLSEPEDPPEYEDAYAAPPPPNAGGTSPYALAIAVGAAAAHATEQNARFCTVCVLAFFLNDAAHVAQESKAFFPIPGGARVDPADDDATTAGDVPFPGLPEESAEPNARARRASPSPPTADQRENPPGRLDESARATPRSGRPLEPALAATRTAAVEQAAATCAAIVRATKSAMRVSQRICDVCFQNKCVFGAFRQLGGAGKGADLAKAAAHFRARSELDRSRTRLTQGAFALSIPPHTFGAVPNAPPARPRRTPTIARARRSRIAHFSASRQFLFASRIRRARRSVHVLTSAHVFNAKHSLLRP